MTKPLNKQIEEMPTTKCELDYCVHKDKVLSALKLKVEEIEKLKDIMSIPPYTYVNLDDVLKILWSDKNGK